ncbi:MAG TPA: sulfite exporter TauE/SafE family protein [Burkholderiales bacterium]|nr:sulfite exporter TauE/SafE family protein [Burkholderiales bacterium]
MTELLEFSWPLLLAYLALGAFVGFLAGMLGIGGGATMVPILVLLFEPQGFPREHIVHIAVGTAMATILFTSISSVRAHARRGAVRWDIAKAMTPGILLGGFLGALIASRLSTLALGIFFAVFIYCMSLNMWLNRQPPAGGGAPSRTELVAMGGVISALSALVAIGGAAMSVPYMVWRKVPLIHAIGTSSAIGFPVALASTAGYIWMGTAQEVPSPSLGYVYLPATLSIVAASVFTAPLGARAAHKLPTGVLRRVFATLLFVLATRMLIKLW